MNKRLLWALVLIAVLVIVLLLNSSGRVSVTLMPKVHITTARSVVFFVFTALGVAVGLLLK